MLETNLSRRQIWLGWFTVGLSLVLAVVLLAIIMSVFKPLEWWLLPLAIVALVSLLALNIMLVRVLLRRSIHRRNDARLWGTIVGIIMAAISFALLRLAWVTGDLAISLEVVVIAMIVLGALGVVTVIHFMEQHHLDIQEKMLELELRLAELADKIDGRA